MDNTGATVSANPQDLTTRDAADCWYDAQSVLHEITEQLQHGQMLQSEHFSLFEAMSAVEIGDPKMDAGLDTATAPTPDALIEQGLAPLELSGAQLIATLDRLAAMQASWHIGNTIAQTVFVCLYMLKPDRCKKCTYDHATIMSSFMNTFDTLLFALQSCSECTLSSILRSSARKL